MKFIKLIKEILEIKKSKKISQITFLKRGEKTDVKDNQSLIAEDDMVNINCGTNCNVHTKNWSTVQAGNNCFIKAGSRNVIISGDYSKIYCGVNSIFSCGKRSVVICEYYKPKNINVMHKLVYVGENGIEPWKFYTIDSKTAKPFEVVEKTPELKSMFTMNCGCENKYYTKLTTKEN